jgi:hypothetical protein
MTQHILVERWSGYETACGFDCGSDQAVWHTASPYVLERLTQEGRHAVSVESLTDQRELDSLGCMALEILRKWGRLLDDSQPARQASLPLGRLILPQLRLLLVPILVRAVLADRWARQVVEQAGASCSVVSVRSLSRVHPGFARFKDADTLMAWLLARSEWKNRLRIIHQEGSAVQTSAASGHGRSRIEQALGWANAGASKLAYGLWLRWRKGKAVRLPWKTPKKEIFLFGNNELVKESFLALLRRGARLSMLSLPKPAGDGRFAMPVILDEQLRSLLSRSFLESTASHDSPCMRTAAETAIERLENFFGVFLPYADRASREFASPGAGSRLPSAVLSHGLTDPLELLFYHLARRSRIPIVEVQHGGSAGLTHAHSGSVELAEINACQASVVYNRNFEAYYRSRLNGRMPPTLISGAPSVTRRDRHPRLARRLARRMLGVSPKDRAVLYVTNMFYGNSLAMPHGHLDTHYYAFQRQIILNVLPQIPATGLVKLYPTSAQAEPHPLLALRDLAPNVRIVQRGDFRYLRSGADVLILDVPYGTLGWALAADVPTVFLDMPSNPLLPEIVPRIEKALFRVDCSQPDWPMRLRSLLQMDPALLSGRWRSMLAERAAFMEECLLGPAGQPGNRIADFTLDFQTRETNK